MAYTDYLQKHKEKGTALKVFLDNKTMLSGKITSFSENFIVLDHCLINVSKIISISPQ